MPVISCYVSDFLFPPSFLYLKTRRSSHFSKDRFVNVSSSTSFIHSGRESTSTNYPWLEVCKSISTAQISTLQNQASQCSETERTVENISSRPDRKSIKTYSVFRFEDDLERAHSSLTSKSRRSFSSPSRLST